MTWSYDPTTLATSAKDQVRFYVGDTDSTSPQLQDEEIAFAVTVRGNAFGATALCAEALKAKYSRLVSMSADGVSVQNGQKATAYALIAKDYQSKEVLYYGVAYAGGISQADMRAVISNPDRVPDLFRYGMFDDPASDGVNPVSPGSGGGYPWGFPP